MTTRTRAAGILTAITMTALMAACSSASDGGGDSDASGVTSSGEMSDSGGGSGQAPGGASSRGASGDGAALAEDADTESGAGSGSDSAVIPETERSIIAKGTISLSSEDVAETRREVQRIVDAQGGDITDENTESDDEGETTYARLVIRVPSAKFSEAMVALEKAAVFRSSNRGSEDVTTEVIDTRARLRAQEASLKRVELLLAEADSLKDIIWIESQLTSRQAELDSLKSQQAWLADQTSLSTITVDISAHPEVQEEETDEAPAGFVAGLKGGTKALSAMLVTVLTVLGALLPFAVVAAVIGLPIWLVVRRRRATDAPAPTA